MCVTVIRMCRSISTVQKVDKTEILNLKRAISNFKIYLTDYVQPTPSRDPARSRSCMCSPTAGDEPDMKNRFFVSLFFETPRILDLTICALHRRNNWYVFISEYKTTAYKISWSKIAEIDNTVNLFSR